MSYYQNMIDEFDSNEIEVEDKLTNLVYLLETFKRFRLIDQADWEREFDHVLEKGCRCGGCYESQAIGVSLYVYQLNGHKYEISSV